MPDFNTAQLDEIHCLALFDLKNTQIGLKVHNTAKPESVAAMQRLFDKGLVTEADGGYLTTLGIEAAEFAQDLQTILRPIDNETKKTAPAKKATKETEVEAAVFRHLVKHLDEHKEVQNIDLMILAGFCRNCLSKWYLAEAEKLGVTANYDTARERVYGMPYSEWKEKYQQDASAEQLKAFNEKHC